MSLIATGLRNALCALVVLGLAVLTLIGAARADAALFAIMALANGGPVTLANIETPVLAPPLP